jgi:dynein heavy chain
VLAAKNAVIAEKKIDVEKIIFDISGKTEVANEKQKIATKMKAELSVQSKEISLAKAEATEELKAAAPMLAAAKQALSNVQPKDITEIKALANPPQAVKQAITLAFFYFINDGNDDWGNVKLKMLGDMKMLEKLKTYEIGDAKNSQSTRCKQLYRALKKEYGCEGAELQETMNKKSAAAGGLFKWATSTDSCFDIFQMVEPKRKKAELMAAKLEAANKELAETEANLNALNESLAVLNANKKVKADELQELEDQSNLMTAKLNAAEKLITGLSGEQVRWAADMERFKEDKIKLLGDCLTASAFLSYTGPFNFILRQRMIHETWKKDIIAKEIPTNEILKLESFLVDEVIVSRWASEGLPTDELSIQNGILTSFASRWPLCIDPQMQAVTWIKTKESRSREFRCMTFNTHNYLKTLELAIKFGQSVLFEAIGIEIDPMIDPVLEKNIVTEAGVEMLLMNDQKIEFNQDFRLFMTTKIGNPNYTPEIFGKTMIINFSVTMMGLRDQLLNEVVKFERPEVEEQRKQLIQETSANKAELKELEELLLLELTKDSDLPLVDNVPLIQTLDMAKTKSVKIENALINAKKTALEIEATRESYKGVAKRGAILCFALFGLSEISDMYEYSLNSYMTVFMNALETSKKDNVLQARLKFITDKLTQLVYEFTCMGIFERHKLMFSFQMTTMIMDGDDILNKEELDFFLKGNTSLDEVEAKPHKWISENGWKDAVKLDEMGGVFEGFCQNVKSNEKAWKEWYDLEAPEMNPMPSGYDKKLDKFQSLLVCKIFRNDRCINAIKNFIISQMADVYVKSPPIDYEKIYKSSTEKTPIIFILSPGADPQNEVQRLVESHGPGMGKFKFLALGQGMGDQAKEFIESGAIRGWWVMLQNCHLLTSWLSTLEATIEGIQKPDKGFRLWLTTNPIDPHSPIRFPLGILQRSLKVVTEPPDGLQANIKMMYSKLNDELLSESPKEEFRSLVYVLSFFHATIQERKKFGKIGWNVSYDFNDSDYRISFNLIALYLNKAIETNEEELPW